MISYHGIRHSYIQRSSTLTASVNLSQDPAASRFVKLYHVSVAVGIIWSRLVSVIFSRGRRTNNG
jgi:hypothetical protein